MKRQKRSHIHKKRHGFTLIELMASIAIIGIISALALNRYSTVLANGRVAKEQSVLSAVEKAKDLFVAEESRAYSELQQYNAMNAADKYTVLSPYIRLNGVQVDSGSLLLGTGKTKLDPGLITFPQFIIVSGTSVSVVAGSSATSATLF